MTPKFLIALFLLVTVGREIAFVDLTISPKTPEPKVNKGAVRGIGGILYHGNAPHPAPGTPTLRLKLNRVLPVTINSMQQKAVEVFAINTGKVPISVPIGTDYVPLLKPPAPDRRYLTFTVTLGKDLRVGVAQSASNGITPEASATLRPGDQVTFLLPVIAPYRVSAEDEISVSVQQFRRVLDNGTDWTEGMGESIRSENLIPLP